MKPWLVKHILILARLFFGAKLELIPFFDKNPAPIKEVANP